MLILLYFILSALSAFLLFMVQPLAAKAALPILGGAPFVWNGCMVFFQTLLLGGYGYVHLMQRHIRLDRQLYVHLALLALALCAAPVAFFLPNSPGPALHPQLWLTLMLALNMGLPFFALSATAPIAQRWFSASAHVRADNPYFLYAASNLGSFAALLSYPFIIEPWLNITQQLAAARIGFVALFLLFTAIAVGLKRSAAHTRPAPAAPAAPRPLIAQWVMLAFVPSSLLYGVTTYITTDVASLPLFWVIPLALYLLSFVLVFSPRQPGVALCRELHMPLAGMLVIFLLLSHTFALWVMVLHLSVFFITAVACHARLAALAPPASGLTRFYLWMALGGVLGGAFNTFIAPHIFTSVFEYPLMLMASMALSLPLTKKLLAEQRPKLLATVLIALAIGLVLPLIAQFFYTPLMGLLEYAPYELTPVVNWIYVYAFFTVLALFCMKRPAQALVLVACALCIHPIVRNYIYIEQNLFTERTIFGVSRVLYNQDADANMYEHGTTKHGVQSQEEGWRLKPGAYYGPVGSMLTALDPALSNAPVAGLGLGVGTIACHGKPGQHFDFFEIDPLVERIARDPHLFTYLRDCPPQSEVHIGDARIGISHMPDSTYGLIVADTFSSDAVPAHMLTKEAADIYFAKLAPKGAVAFNVSNRHLDLTSVVQALAATQHAKAYFLKYEPQNPALEYETMWVVLSRDEQFGKRLLAGNLEWQDITSQPRTILWTDDFTNVARTIKWFK